jgi:hypothetical protein
LLRLQPICFLSRPFSFLFSCLHGLPVGDIAFFGVELHADFVSFLWADSVVFGVAGLKYSAALSTQRQRFLE